MTCINDRCECESSPIVVVDNAGREIFWEDLGRKDD